jgi:hypothetical protein
MRRMGRFALAFLLQQTESHLAVVFYVMRFLANVAHG